MSILMNETEPEMPAAAFSSSIDVCKENSAVFGVWALTRPACAKVQRAYQVVNASRSDSTS
jgi:hypothetical protein